MELPQLVCSNLDDYKRLAIDLACDPESLSSLRTHLQQGRGQFALFDTEAFTRHLERAYLEMAERHRTGTAAEFAV